MIKKVVNNILEGVEDIISTFLPLLIFLLFAIPILTVLQMKDGYVEDISFSINYWLICFGIYCIRWVIIGVKNFTQIKRVAYALFCISFGKK